MMAGTAGGDRTQHIGQKRWAAIKEVWRNRILTSMKASHPSNHPEGGWHHEPFAA